MKTVEFSSKATGRGTVLKLGSSLNGERFDRISIRCSPKDAADPRVLEWIKELVINHRLPQGKITISIYE